MDYGDARDSNCNDSQYLVFMIQMQSSDLAPMWGEGILHKGNGAWYKKYSFKLSWKYS